MAKKTYSTFLARVYRIELCNKRIYVYYAWSKPGSNNWSKSDMNGMRYSWTVPDSPEGNEGYDKLAELLYDEECNKGDNYVNINPEVELEVTMIQQSRGKFKDEYFWKYIKRLSPPPETSCYEELFEDE